MSPLEIALVVLLGTIAGFDTVSFPQAMISRPIVAATLGGLVTGDAAMGLLCGAILECFALETLPVGASRYPEWGSASVVGGALFAGSGGAPGALAVSVVVALSGAWLGGWSMIQLRTFNAKHTRRAQDGVDRGDVRVIRGLQLGGLLWDFLRAGALTSFLLAVALPLGDVFVASWSFSLGATRLIVAVVAVAVAAGAMWKHFSSAPYGRSIILGALAAGIALYFAV